VGLDHREIFPLKLLEILKACEVNIWNCDISTMKDFFAMIYSKRFRTSRWLHKRVGWEDLLYESAQRTLNQPCTANDRGDPAVSCKLAE